MNLLLRGIFLVFACSLLSVDAFLSTSHSSPATTELLASTSTDFGSTTHVVDGVVCREMPLDVPAIGTVIVLEATAQSQEDLVDMALALEDEEAGLLEAGDPYGAVLWPSAWAVARYILSEQKLALDNMSILELGTGTGLVSIALALGGAKHVLATDYEPLALKLMTYAASTFHPETMAALDTKVLDMCNYDDKLPQVDLVVAADIMYEPKTGIAMAHRAVEALRQGSRVIVGDSPGRPGRPAFLKALQELGVEGAEFVETIGRTCTGPRHDLICGEGSPSVSETPKALSVAIMDLNPKHLMK
ncbi:MAG: hypothetical protein SGBAC_008421 [Bacillariaceae sp.]